MQRRNARVIISIGLLWTGLGIVYVVLERSLLGSLNYYPATGNPYNFFNSATLTISSSFLTGVLFGSIELLFLNRKIAHKPFGLKILIKTIIYLVMACLLLLSLSFFSNSIQLKRPLFDAGLAFMVFLFFSNFAFWGLMFYIGVTIVLTLFLIEISGNLGQGAVRNFLLGKYHRPREETRVFMFLDMKSSTSIAEELGHVRYFELLNAYYADMTDSILKTSGIVYKYVGDEIIISWEIKRGLLQKNCLDCFFSIKQVFEKKAENYRKTFGMNPEFKAGIHLGPVTVGEIGVLKKEIAFNGDVLNTTARIQSMCNTYGVDNLISEDLYTVLKGQEAFKFEEIGVCVLRGKEKEVKLYTAEKI